MSAPKLVFVIGRKLRHARRPRHRFGPLIAYSKADGPQQIPGRHGATLTFHWTLRSFFMAVLPFRGAYSNSSLQFMAVSGPYTYCV